MLSLLCFIPTVGALTIIFFIKKDDEKSIKYTAFGVSLLEVLLSLPLVFLFESNTHEFQFVQKVSWIPPIGAEYFVGIDGISILLVLLTTILTAISVLSSFSAITERQKEYYCSMLILETGMIGVFISLDLFLFYVFWEVMLVPMYFLIGIWGGPRRLYAAIKFFLFTLFGSVFLLLGILALYFLYHDQTGTYSFNIVQLYQMTVPYSYQFWVFLAFFLAFAIKVPMFPFHTWLPDAHVEAPTAASVILAGILLKMGTYGFVRFTLPLLPEASRELAPFMALLALIGIIYGALVTLAQKDLKKLIAYSSVSHLGFVVLGIFTLNTQGVMGGMMQMVNHGISTGALFLIVGIIYERRHTRMISDFGGLSKEIPVFATIFAITALSSLGLPGLNNFIGEFLVLMGAVRRNYLYATFAIIGIVLGAAYLLWTYQRMMFGPLDKSENQGLFDCTFREMAYMGVLVLFMFWIGLYPRPYLRMMESSVVHLITQQVNRVAVVPQDTAEGTQRASEDPPRMRKVPESGGDE